MVMPGFEFWWWPIGAATFGLMAIVWVLLLIFWIWMIVDAARRNFRNNVEKVVWIVVVVLGGWIGALVYFIVIRNINPRGLAKK